MTEAQETDLRTLAFMTGPFSLSDITYDTSPSRWRNKDGTSAKDGDEKERERYVSGISLTLAHKSGRSFSVRVPLRSIDYARINALLLEGTISKGTKLNFTWDEAKARVIVTGALA
jgi:hypothetical protein